MSSELDRFTNGYRTREQVHRRLTDIPPPEPDSEPERSQTTPAIGSPLGMSRQAWESLDSISVQDEFQTPVASLQAVPHFLVEPVKKALELALRGIVEPNPAAAITAERSWKLLLLIPRRLLGRPAQTGAIGKRTLRQRASTFAEGHWHQLLDGVRGPEPGRRRAPSSAEACADRAAAQVRRGETIPGTADTYQFAAGAGDRRNPSNSARPNSETTSPPKQHYPPTYRNTNPRHLSASTRKK